MLVGAEEDDGHESEPVSKPSLSRQGAFREMPRWAKKGSRWAPTISHEVSSAFSDSPAVKTGLTRQKRFRDLNDLKPALSRQNASRDLVGPAWAQKMAHEAKQDHIAETMNSRQKQDTQAELAVLRDGQAAPVDEHGKPIANQPAHVTLGDHLRNIQGDTQYKFDRKSDSQNMVIRSAKDAFKRAKHKAWKHPGKVAAKALLPFAGIAMSGANTVKSHGRAGTASKIQHDPNAPEFVSRMARANKTKQRGDRFKSGVGTAIGVGGLMAGGIVPGEQLLGGAAESAAEGTSNVVNDVLRNIVEEGLENFVEMEDNGRLLGGSLQGFGTAQMEAGIEEVGGATTERGALQGKRRLHSIFKRKGAPKPGSYAGDTKYGRTARLEVAKAEHAQKHFAQRSGSIGVDPDEQKGSALTHLLSADPKYGAAVRDAVTREGGPNPDHVPDNREERQNFHQQLLKQTLNRSVTHAGRHPDDQRGVKPSEVRKHDSGASARLLSQQMQAGRKEGGPSYAEELDGLKKRWYEW